MIPNVEFHEQSLTNASLDMRAAIATSLVIFALFFTCVYLMPSLNCEEYERGLLLAQALSPATTLELLGAKFLFYPTFGMILAVILAAIHDATVLYEPLFWGTLFTLAVGTLGIGMTVSSIARTQRSASMGALCYMLVIALVLLICQQNNITLIPNLTLEYHAPHLLHAVMTHQLQGRHTWNFIACVILSFSWLSAAIVLFRQRGWQ